MTGRHLPLVRISPLRLWAFAPSIALLIAALSGNAQTAAPTNPYERNYVQPKSTVEKVLRELQPALSGRLPVLDGFAVEGERPLNRYQRAYYQSIVKVNSTPSGGSVVRVSTKVTAWYTDSNASRSGYQLVTSNGRLENDLLDQLTDLLASAPNAASAARDSGGISGLDFPPTAHSTAAGNKTANTRADTSPRKPDKNVADAGTAEPIISAPMPRSTEANRPFGSIAGSTAQPALSGQELAGTKNAPSKPADRATASLQAEAASLEEVLKNQAHPKNLVAIKKSGTPVVSTPSLNGKTLFLASAQDEFEMLDFNADWVHVRISGLSRGWIWRTSLEMPQGISDIPKADPSGKMVAADLFQVTREETAPFPGDWEPLRGKAVKIISVQKIQEGEKDSGAQAKLEYAKSLIDKNYADLASKAKELGGIVFIFDSVDGGMIAATLSTVQAWKAGTLSDAALWHQCYFDPPETFTISSSPASGH
jgi:hypothetical protein